MRTFFKSLVVQILTLQSRAVLRKYKPKIVAVTGSVGKTSTKDAIYAVLAQSARVRASQKSFNSEIGLPLTILGVPNGWNNPLRWLQNCIDGVFMLLFDVRYPEWLVLEVGADRPGDIRSLANWLPVDVAVITRLPEVPVHVEFFDSPEAVIEEKASLIDAIKPGGALVLFADDPRTLALMHRLPAPDARVYTFGFSARADVRGEHIQLLRESGSAQDGLASPEGGWPVGMSAQVVVGESSMPLNIYGAVGPHAFMPALAAAAVGHALGMSLATMVPALGAYKPPPGRMRLVPGIKGALLIDDTYNSSPAAALAALDTLALVMGESDSPKKGRKTLVQNKGRRIVALADMLELGRHSTAEHRKLGAHAAKTCDLLATVGFRARDIVQGALDAGMKDEQILQFEDAARAGEELKNIVQPGDCVLCKGSQSMRMERVVEALMAEPERAKELLVRQDEEWKKR